MNLYVKENIPSTIKISWKTAVTAPKEYCHFLNLIRIYKKTTIKEPITARNELFLISSAIVGPTLMDDIIPTCLLSEPFTKES